MRKVTCLLPLMLVLAACTPAAPPEPPAAPTPPVDAQPEPAAPVTVEAPVAAATPGAAAAGMPPAGSYGFNWLDPENSTCKELTEQDLAKVSQCTTSSNAFGLELESHACRVDDKVEYIVYKDAAQCQEGFETMQANGD